MPVLRSTYSTLTIDNSKRTVLVPRHNSFRTISLIALKIVIIFELLRKASFRSNTELKEKERKRERGEREKW